MNETTELFILAGVFICIAAFASGHVILLGKIAEVRERIIALEVKDEVQSRKNARIMHSPHNPYGMDSLIDKYLDRHYELTATEWQEWMHRCEKLIEAPDDKVPKEDKVIAVQLLCVCWHKLMMPPPFRKLIDKAADKVEDALIETKKLSNL